MNGHCQWARVKQLGENAVERMCHWSKSNLRYNINTALEELYKTATASVKIADFCTKFQITTPPEALLPKPTTLVSADNTHTHAHTHKLN
jgi:hypothetical protein